MDYAKEFERHYKWACDSHDGAAERHVNATLALACAVKSLGEAVIAGGMASGAGSFFGSSLGRDLLATFLEKAGDREPKK